MYASFPVLSVPVQKGGVLSSPSTSCAQISFPRSSVAALQVEPFGVETGIARTRAVKFANASVPCHRTGSLACSQRSLNAVVQSLRALSIVWPRACVLSVSFRVGSHIVQRPRRSAIRSDQTRDQKRAEARSEASRSAIRSAIRTNHLPVARR